MLALAGIEIFLRVHNSLVRNRQIREQEEQGQITLAGYTPEFMQRYYWHHPVIGNRHAPNVNLRIPFSEHPSGHLVFRTNNLGLQQDEDVPIEKPQGVFRVLVLGDSMTEGIVHNCETYSSLLETKLNEEERARGKSTEDLQAHKLASVHLEFHVLNAGVGGYSTLQEYLWLKVYGRSLQPDLIILSFYAGNDIVDLADQRDDPYLAAAIEEVGGDVQDESLLLKTGLGARIKWYLRRNLRLYPLLWRIKDRLWGEEGHTYTAETTKGAQDSSPGEGYSSVIGQCLEQANLAQKHPQIAEAALLLQELILRRLAQEANDLEARLLVVMIPTKLQVEPEDDQERINAVAATLGLEGRELHFDDRIVERVLNMCRSNQIPIADMGPALRQAARDGVAAHCTGCTVPVLPFTLDGARSYWRQGWHLSVEGNAIVAGQIYEYLQAHPQLLAVERQR
jgi:hypothetical protein